MLHRDKDLTRAISLLLQEDLKQIIEESGLKFEILDGGITVPPANILPNSLPRASFYLRQMGYIPPNDFMMRQKYSGGKFFTMFLTINDEVDLGLWSRSSQHLSKYDGQAHAICVAKRGESWDNRFKQSMKYVCDGIYGMIDIPDFSWHLANKILKVISSHIASGSVNIKAH